MAPKCTYAYQRMHIDQLCKLDSISPYSTRCPIDDQRLLITSRNRRPRSSCDLEHAEDSDGGHESGHGHRGCLFKADVVAQMERRPVPYEGIFGIAASRSPKLMQSGNAMPDVEVGHVGSGGVDETCDVVTAVGTVRDGL